MYSIAILSPTPQMSNCVNQRMEFRVFERVADRDYSSRVMAVRWAPSFKFEPFLTLPLLENLSYLWPNYCSVKPLLSCTFLTNPQQTLTDPSDPNISDPADFRCDWSECVEQRNAWRKIQQLFWQLMIAPKVRDCVLFCMPKSMIDYRLTTGR